MAEEEGKGALVPATPERSHHLPALDDPERAALLQSMLSYSNAIELSLVLKAKGWSLEKELDILIDLAESAKAERTKLGALKALQERRKEALEAAGLRVRLTATEHQDLPDGGRVERKVSAHALLDSREQIEGLGLPAVRTEETENVEETSGEESDSEDGGGTPRTGSVAKHQPPKGSGSGGGVAGR